jgi:hypothetical protein
VDERIKRLLSFMFPCLVERVGGIIIIYRNHNRNELQSSAKPRKWFGVQYVRAR